MNTLEAFHVRCQWQTLDVCWWAHISNTEMLQRSGLSTIGDVLRHRRLSLFGHVARLDPRVTAHDALHLMVDLRRQEANGQLEKTTRPPSQRLAQQDSRGCKRSTAIYSVRSAIARGHGAAQRFSRTTRRQRRRWWWWWKMWNLCQKWRVKLFFSSHLYRLSRTALLNVWKSLTYGVIWNSLM